MAKIAAFRDWTGRWQNAGAEEKEAMRQEGRQLAQERRAEFKALIVANPREALAQAVPRVIRQDLPAEIVGQLESPVSARGEYIKYLGLTAPGMPKPERSLEFQTFETEQGESYNAHVFGTMESVMWKKAMPLQGVAVDQELAVAASPVRRLEEGERIPAGTIVAAVCPVSEKSTTVPSAGEVVTVEVPTIELAGQLTTVCEPAHVEVIEQENLVKLEAKGPGGANTFVENHPGKNMGAVGTRQFLYIRAVYPDQLEPPITEDQAKEDLANTSRFYQEGSYGKLTVTSVVTPVIVMPRTKSWYYAVGGLGQVHTDARSAAAKLGYDPDAFDCRIVRINGGPQLDGSSWGGGPNVWMSWSGMDGMNHECGHSMGRGHANSWQSTDGTPYGNGTEGNYGNPYDVMGGGYGFGAHYNAQAKRQMNWLTDSYVHLPTANGTYRLYAYDQPVLEEGKRYAMEVEKDVTRKYSLEYHPAYGPADAVLVMFSGGGGKLLNITPGRSRGMLVGRTFSDLEADVHFTMVARNYTNPPSVDVVYNRGPFIGNQPPVVSLAASATTISPGGSVTFTASASDPNGDALAYWWEFDDAVIASTNTPTFTRTFTNPSQVTAMLTVSDMKGGATRRHVVINVGSHGLQTVTGAITAGGQPLQNVKVTSGSKYCYTDASGNYVLTGITAGSQTLAATLNGYTLTPSFANPLTVTTGTNTADWTAGNATNFVTVQKLADASEGGTAGSFRFTRGGDLSAALDVRIPPPLGTATRTTDYVFSPDAVSDGDYLKFTIPAGQATLDVAVNAVNDSVTEANETLTIQLASNGTYLSQAANSIALVIADNDTTLPLLSVAATQPSAKESSAQAGAFTFTRSGSTAAAMDIPVAWSGTAANGMDYSPLPSTVTIPAGQSSTVVSINPINDNVPEGYEKVTTSFYATPNNWVKITRVGSVLTGYRSNDGVSWTQTGTSTISMNSNVLVGLALSSHSSSNVATATFDNVSVTDLAGGDIGTYTQQGSMTESVGVFTLTASGGDIWGGADRCYFASKTLSGDGEIRARITSVTNNLQWIKAGVMVRETSSAGSKNVMVGISGGGAEYLYQYRSTADGSTSSTTGPAINTATGYGVNSATKTATVTIADGNEPVVSVSVPDAAASESGDTGVFLITRSGSTVAPLKVYYSVSGTAYHGTDYRPLSGEVVIPAGASSAPVVITPIDDNLGEITETVNMSLATYNNVYSLGAAYNGSVSIIDNQDVPLVSVRSVTGTEGGNNARVIFRSIGSGSGNVTVRYTVSGTATPGADYTAPSGTVSVPVNGANDTTVTIPILDDSTVEPTESVMVKITPDAAYGAYNDDTTTAVILDNDGGDRVKVSNYDEAPTEAGTLGHFMVSRQNSTGDLTVNYTIAGTATNGSDYTMLPGSVVIPATQQYAVITLTPINDALVEGAESVTLTVEPGTGYTPDYAASATYSIADDETPEVNVGFALASQATTEQLGGNGEYRDIAVNLSAASSNTVTVDYSYGGGTASGDDVDWALVNAAAGNALIQGGTLTFAPGTTSQNIRVRVKNDGLPEQGETAIIRLDRPRFAGLATGTHTITITDGVTPSYIARFAASATSRGEPDGNDPLLMVVLDRPCGATPITVNYSVGGTATAGVDYTLSPGTVTFNEGEQAKSLPLTILQDSIADAGETIVVTLTNPSGTTLGSPVTHTITLFDQSCTSGVWSNVAGGTWPNGANWTGGAIAFGPDSLADFSTLDLGADVAVTLDGVRLIGSLKFGDTTPSHQWTLNPGGGGTLTLDGNTFAPTITVANQSATVAVNISGNEGLVKAGAGALVLSGNNGYTGGTILRDGNLYLGGSTGTALGAGDLVIEPSANGLDNGAYLLSNQRTGVVHFNGSGWNYIRTNGFNWTLPGLDGPEDSSRGVVENGGAGQNVSLSGTLTLDVANGASYTFGGAARNADSEGGSGLLSVVKNGPGTQTFKGSRINYSGTTTVNEGTLVLSKTNDLNTSIANHASVEIHAVTGGDWELNSDRILSGAGTWIKTGAGRATLNSATVTASGSFQIREGLLKNGSGWADWGDSTVDMEISGGAILDVYGDAMSLDQLAGTGIVQNGYDSVSFVGKLVVGTAGGSSTFDGVIRDQAPASGTASAGMHLEKTGTGTFTLTGDNTYSGTTKVNAGTLVVNGSIATGAVTVVNASTLGGTGTLGGATTVQSGGTLAPGAGGVGTLTINNTLTLAGTAQLEIRKTGGTRSSDGVAGISTLTYGGALVVSKLGSDALVNGDTFTLFSASAGYTGNFASVSLPLLDAGLAWDITQLSVNGSVTVRSGTQSLPPDGDPDGDGVTTALELAAGTDPQNAASQPSPLYVNLRAWWKLDEAGGTMTDDATGRPQDGTLLNAPLWTPGAAGSGVALNGTDQSVQIPLVGFSSNTVTISAWVKRNGAQAQWTGLVCDAGVKDTGLIFGTGNELRYSWNDTSSSYNFTSNLVIPDNIWTFCAVVVEPAKATIYMQPAGAAMQSVVSTVSHSAHTFSTTAYLGQYPGYKHFKGALDEVRIYSRALSTAEIGQLSGAINPPEAPSFTTNPISKPTASEGSPYTGSTLAGSVSDPDAGDTFTFTKVSGPAWLIVASNGALSGTPGSADVGANSFTVRVTDAAGFTADATLQLTVISGNYWSNVAGGSWQTTTNWSAGIAPAGADKTADFSMLNLTGDTTVTLDGARTIGKLMFGDITPSHNWTLNAGTGGALTLDYASGSPEIAVYKQTTTIGAALEGNKGLNKTGAGTLVLTGNNTYTGVTNVSAGTLVVGNVSKALGSEITIASGATVESKGKLLTNAIGANQIALVTGAGTLALRSTTNSTTSPDIYFNANNADSNTSTSNSGTSIDTAVDLGSGQRYVWGKTNHNSVSKYLTSTYGADANFKGAISGSGGLTFIAQNTYAGSDPMEMPFVLSGNNTFTGMLEIQRGSVYLNHVNALAQGNVLLLSPATGNNARFFLYGKNASVSNLTSSGVGNASIANGNLASGAATALARGTLTVNQTAPTTYAGTLVDHIAEYNKTGSSTQGPLALIKAGPATLSLSGTNTYTGATTIEEGALAITGSLGNTAVEAKSGGTLMVGGNCGGAVTIRSNGRLAFQLATSPAGQVARTIGGALTFDSGSILDLSAQGQPADGTYVLANAASISGLPATIVMPSGVRGSVSVQGTSLRLTVASGYASWVADYNVGGKTAPADDADGDGVPNSVEYITGTNPSAPGSAVIAAQKTGGNFVFTFNRADYAESPGVQVTIEAGASPGALTQAFQIGDTSANSSAGVTVAENGNNADTVVVTIPVTGEARYFARLKVVLP